jgi:hypothetical protein
LQDQNSLVREMADKIEDVVLRRLKIAAWVIGLTIAVAVACFGLFGIKTFYDIYMRIQPAITALEQRVETTNQAINEASTKVGETREALNRLSTQVDEQAARLVARNGEISQKLASLDTVEHKVEEITNQVDNLTIRQVYPTLGQQRFVTYLGNRWKGAAGKQPTDKWINIAIEPSAFGVFSPEKIDLLTRNLREAGYTPLLGSFGIGGPTPTSAGDLGLMTGDSDLFFF